MTKKTIYSKAHIFNFKKEIINPYNKGCYIESIIRAQVHIARIAKNLLIEKFPNKIEEIRKWHEKRLYEQLFCKKIISCHLFCEIIYSWNQRIKYAHNITSINISKEESLESIKQSEKIIQELEKIKNSPK